jgi:hypothetical protein
MNVTYLNSWLDCPDDILRRNYQMQTRINEARVTFFYKLKEKGYSDRDMLFMYQIWVQKNKDRIKLLCPHPSEGLAS